MLAVESLCIGESGKRSGERLYKGNYAYDSSEIRLVLMYLFGDKLCTSLYSNGHAKLHRAVQLLRKF